MRTDRLSTQNRTILAAIGYLLVIGLVLVPDGLNAQIVRGRLEMVDTAGRPYPAFGVAVTLSSPNSGRSTAANTNRQGTFVFYNIPPGRYTLEIWIRGKQPLRYAITVKPSSQVTEIPPIKVPRTSPSGS